MRDNDIETLRQLLNSHAIHFDTEPPAAVRGDEDDDDDDDDDAPLAAAQPVELKCMVKEQKESPNGLVDEPCGRASGAGFAGLCR